MRDFKRVKRVLIKIGSSSLVKEDNSINEMVFVSIMGSIKKLMDKGIHTSIVTSGAIACGMYELKLEKRPEEMALKQACAAVGQSKLMEEYNKIASIYNLKVGQILLNHDDFQVRKRMLYLTSTLDAMIKNGIIPIVNENDALAVEEIKVGDNDTLASLLSPMIHCDLLILFSDIDGLYTKNPHIYRDAKKVSDVYEIDDAILEMVGDATSSVGTGGMKTKIDAASIATRSGVDMIICNSRDISKLNEIIEGEEIGTLFHKRESISSREHWIIFKTKSSGSITVDSGLEVVLNQRKSTILPKGIMDVSGDFLSGVVLDIRSQDGSILGKGICNYSSQEIKEVLGLSSEVAKERIKFNSKRGILHADDIVLFKEGYYGSFIK